MSSIKQRKEEQKKRRKKQDTEEQIRVLKYAWWILIILGVIVYTGVDKFIGMVLVIVSYVCYFERHHLEDYHLNKK